MIFKNIILCPSFSGQKKKGVKFFPQLIKPYIKSKYNIHNTEIYNNVFFDNLQIYNNCMNFDKHICIGGDHSIAIGTCAASLNKHKNVKFIWIDAHADINTFNASFSKNYHGMPLAYLTGLDNNKYFSFIKNKLKYNNIFYIGLRDIDNFESNVIKEKKINTVSCKDVNNNYLDIYNKLKKYIDNSPIHISFDVDSVNPKYISSTGTIVENGLELTPIKKLLQLLYLNENVVALDIVEMNMEINKQDYFSSLNNFKYIFSDIFN